MRRLSIKRRTPRERAPTESARHLVPKTTDMDSPQRRKIAELSLKNAVYLQTSEQAAGAAVGDFTSAQVLASRAVRHSFAFAAL